MQSQICPQGIHVHISVCKTHKVVHEYATEMHLMLPLVLSSYKVRNITWVSEVKGIKYPGMYMQYKRQKTRNGWHRSNKQVISQAVVEAAKDVMLVITGEGKIQSKTIEQNSKKRGHQTQNRTLSLTASFNWSAKYKYMELRNFKIEVMNIFLTRTCDRSDVEGVLIIKNWLGR